MKIWVLYNYEDYGEWDYIRLYATRELAMAALMADIDHHWAQKGPDKIEAVKRKAREAMDKENEWWPSRAEGYVLTEEVVHEEPQR